MKQLLIISFLFISIGSFSQNHLDFGAVKADKSFPCDDQSFVDSIYKLDKICNSKNLFEIRLGITYLPFSDFELIVLSYDGWNWTAKKYKYNLSDAWHDSSKTAQVKAINLKPKEDFSAIFAALKQNNVFTLPNQSDIKAEGFVLDGVDYSLSFKADDKFRTYYFDNPEEYKKRYTRISEFKNYDRIVTILRNWLMDE